MATVVGFDKATARPPASDIHSHPSKDSGQLDDMRLSCLASIYRLELQGNPFPVENFSM
jgi:hypothetical protein